MKKVYLRYMKLTILQKQMRQILDLDDYNFLQLRELAFGTS